LSLLLRADEPWLHAIAGVVTIASKFVLRIDGRHIWNPAGVERNVDPDEKGHFACLALG